MLKLSPGQHVYGLNKRMISVKTESWYHRMEEQGDIELRDDIIAWMNKELSKCFSESLLSLCLKNIGRYQTETKISCAVKSVALRGIMPIIHL